MGHREPEVIFCRASRLARQNTGQDDPTESAVAQARRDLVWLAAAPQLGLRWPIRPLGPDIS